MDFADFHENFEKPGRVGAPRYPDARPGRRVRMGAQRDAWLNTGLWGARESRGPGALLEDRDRRPFNGFHSQFSPWRRIAGGKIRPGAPNGGSRAPGRTIDAGRAFGGAGEGDRDPAMRSQIGTVADVDG